jgi:hypothetical protein
MQEGGPGADHRLPHQVRQQIETATAPWMIHGGGAPKSASPPKHANRDAVVTSSREGKVTWGRTIYIRVLEQSI